MRGKGTLFEQREQMQRITPAYAGKSLSGLSVRLLYRDHPRLCGEKMRRSFEKGYDKGSPPPMRGKVGLIVAGIAALRITPAYAGKSHKNENGDTEFEDHPRLCGEKGRTTCRKAT